MHSSDCYSGITSICSVLNWAAVKSRPNTASSYRAILARVSIAEQVQIWCRMRETSGSWCFLASWLGSSFLGLYPFSSKSVTQWWMKVPGLAKPVWGYRPFTSDWGRFMESNYFQTWKSGCWLERSLKGIKPFVKSLDVVYSKDAISGLFCNIPGLFCRCNAYQINATVRAASSISV